MTSPRDQDPPVLLLLAGLAVVGGISWLYVLMNQPEPEVLPPEPVQVRRIACEAPTQGLEPDANLREVDIQGDDLRARVHRDEGTSLWRDAQGIARLQIGWSGATPGQEAVCTAAIPARARVQGRIHGLDRATLIPACSDGLTEVTEGRFQLETIVGHPCAYWFMDDAGEVVGKVEATAHRGEPLVLAVR